MAGENTSKSYRLNPSWKYFFWEYLLSVLTIPLFGIGLVWFYFVRKKQNSRYYEFTDTQISSYGSKYQRNIDLLNIDSVEVKQSWIQEKLNVGSLIVKTSASKMEIKGMEVPRKLQDILEKAVESERQRNKGKQRTKPREPEYDPGSMEKINYLTGLWQQGLISEEDYEKERKHFED